MKEFFDIYLLVVWSVVSVFMVVVVIMILWEQVKWWWFNIWVCFLLVGCIVCFLCDFNEDFSLFGWYKGESMLCLEYKKFIYIQDEYDFNEKVIYLIKFGDNGCKVMFNWIWLLMILMVFVEVMGFFYVLVGYMLLGVSENLQQIGVYGIVFLILVILVVFIYLVGYELYKFECVNLVCCQWNEVGCKQEFFIGIILLVCL